jgi:hypothetical protein
MAYLPVRQPQPQKKKKGIEAPLMAGQFVLLRVRLARRHGQRACRAHQGTLTRAALVLLWHCCVACMSAMRTVETYPRTRKKLLIAAPPVGATEKPQAPLYLFLASAVQFHFLTFTRERQVPHTGPGNGTPANSQSYLTSRPQQTARLAV